MCRHVREDFVQVDLNINVSLCLDGFERTVVIRLEYCAAGDNAPLQPSFADRADFRGGNENVVPLTVVIKIWVVINIVQLQNFKLASL